MCLSLSSSDTEQEEESYKRHKRGRIEALRSKLEASINKRADRYSSTSSSQSDTANKGEMRDGESSHETDVREDILNRVVKGFNREGRKETARLGHAQLCKEVHRLKALIKDTHRDKELLDTVDVAESVIAELQTFDTLTEEEGDKIAYWQE